MFVAVSDLSCLLLDTYPSMAHMTAGHGATMTGYDCDVWVGRKLGLVP